jgi:thioredoxin reductase (NADPH)
MDNHHDLIIVGSGPIGIACGLEAKNAGLDFLILEKGCLVNSIYNYPLNMTFFSTSEKLEVGNIPFVSNNIKPTRPEALEYYRRVAVSNKLPVNLQEKVLSITSGGSLYKVKTIKQEYFCTHIVIATGFYDIPVLMQIPGEDLPKVTHYYKDPHFYSMQKIVVVGANNSAVDAALETYRKGAEVILVSRSESIGKRVKYWVKPDIENRITEGSIKAYFNSTLTEVREKEVDIQTPQGKLTVANDYVIAMTGYQPDFSLLRNSGITLSDNAVMQPSYTAESMESNMKNIYLAGVVCGGMNTHVWFIENSREHAHKIIQRIAAKRSLPRSLPA